MVQTARLMAIRAGSRQSQNVAAVATIRCHTTDFLKASRNRYPVYTSNPSQPLVIVARGLSLLQEH
jgi:hypothetical protein